MKLISTFYKATNTPRNILLQKIKKKFRKSSELKEVSLLTLDDYCLKHSLFKIDFDFFREYRIEIENYANHSLKNEFNFFSTKFISCSSGNDNHINWQKDQLSGFEWDINTRSKDIIFGVGENEKNPELRKYIGAEIKYPWELGRQQDLVNLAICYAISDDLKEEIKEFYQKRILDFSDHNPIGFGTQWQTSMDVAIRAVNYLISYDILLQANCKFHLEFENHFSQLILTHFFYIYNNLEYSDGLRGNHYFANLMGLIIIYSYLDLSLISDEVRLEIDDIFNFAVNSFAEECLYQFYNDGGNFEASTAYHFFTSEMLLITLFFLEKIPNFENKFIKKKDDIEFRDDLRNRILNIVDFSINFLIGENIPNIGDNDSGIVLDLMPYNYKRYNLIILLDKYKNGDVNFNFRNHNSIINQLTFRNHNYLFAEFFGIARSSNRDFDLITFAGQKGQNGKGGHSHNDKCSFELYFKSKEFIVDLGSAFYTSNWKKRNYYRSVSQHNVLNNGTEQDLFLNNERDDLFWLYGNKSKAKIVYANDKEVKLQHFYYKKKYERFIFLNENSLKGIEKLDTKITKYIPFHFHHSVIIKNENDKIILKVYESEFEFITDEKTEIRNALYSPEYGIEIETKKIVIISNKKEINWEIKLIEH